MNIRNHLLAAAAVLTAVGVAIPANAESAKHYHIFRATSFKDVQGHQPPANDMNYYGGPVLSNAKLVSVIWNSDVVQNTKDQVPLFSAALVDSTYVDQMSEYNTKGAKSVNKHKGTNQVIHRGTYIGQVQLKPHNKSKALSDDDVQAELKRQIADGVLPPSDNNTLYMIYFPSNISITLDGARSCQSFGAYHFATNDSKIAKKSNIFYAVEPECNSGFGFLTFAASHEYAEATTDNVPTPGSNPDFPQAWNDASGYEIGDKCSSSGTLTSTGGSFEVTQVYLNSKHACSTGNYTSP